jgi:hypothetical protein
MYEQTFPPLTPRILAASAPGAGEPTTRALPPPIHAAAIDAGDEVRNDNRGFVYGRSDNSIHQAEALIAELESVVTLSEGS